MLASYMNVHPGQFAMKIETAGLLQIKLSLCIVNMTQSKLWGALTRTRLWLCMSLQLIPFRTFCKDQNINFCCIFATSYLDDTFLVRSMCRTKSKDGWNWNTNLSLAIALWGWYHGSLITDLNKQCQDSHWNRKVKLFPKEGIAC